MQRGREEGTSSEGTNREGTYGDDGTSYSISEGWVSSTLATRSECFRVSVQKLQILVRNRDAHASFYMLSCIFKGTLAYKYLVSHSLPPSLHPFLYTTIHSDRSHPLLHTNFHKPLWVAHGGWTVECFAACISPYTLLALLVQKYLLY